MNGVFTHLPFEMTFWLLGCHSERKRGSFPDVKLRDDGCPRRSSWGETVFVLEQIGRRLYHLAQEDDGIDVVAVADIGKPAILEYLLKSVGVDVVDGTGL